jgi:mono/diheme cytochrome c family protein
MMLCAIVRSNKDAERTKMKSILRIILLQVLFLPVGVSLLSAAPPPAYEGRRLYTSYCQLCHGAGGKGDGALAKAMKIHPADLTTTVRSRSDTILKKIITGEGGPTILLKPNL